MSNFIWSLSDIFQTPLTLQIPHLPFISLPLSVNSPQTNNYTKELGSGDDLIAGEIAIRGERQAKDLVNIESKRAATTQFLGYVYVRYTVN